MREMQKAKVLFVCSANLDRSPTAEKLFHNWKGRWEAKSAGIMPSLGRNPLSQDLIDWADLILVMEPQHAEYIHANFNTNPNKLRVLDVSNRFVHDDPELILELRTRVTPILEIVDRLAKVEHLQKTRAMKLYSQILRQIDQFTCIKMEKRAHYV